MTLGTREIWKRDAMVHLRKAVGKKCVIHLWRAGEKGEKDIDDSVLVRGDD